jgi:hypothetical protein
MTSTFTKAIAAAAALVAASAASAQAQTADRAPTILDLQGAPSARGAVPGFPNLYESYRGKVCTSTVCSVQLDPVPAGATLQATNISCLAGVPLTDPPEEQLVFGLFYPPLTAATVKGFYAAKSKHFWVINESIRAFFPSRSRPSIQVSRGGATTINLSCTLSGNLLR